MRNDRTRNIVIILIWTFIGSIGAYFLYTSVQNGGFSFDSHYAGDPTTVLSDVSISDPIDILQIDWTSGGVKIIPTTDSKIRIVEKAFSDIAADKQVKVTVTGSALNILSRNKTVFSFFGLNSSPTYLEVYVPIKTSFSRIQLNGVSGSYSVDEIYSALTRINLTSGSLILNNSFSDVLYLTMTSGKADITDSEFVDATVKMTSGILNYSAKTATFSAKMTSGLAKLDLLQSIPNSLDLQLTSGSADLTLYGADPFSFTVHKTSGSFNPHYAAVKNGNTYSYQSGGPTYTVDLTSGSVNVDLIQN